MTRIKANPLSAEQEQGKKKPVTGFPFDRLSTELALEIIRCATTPDFDSLITKTKTVNPYSTALSMCLVSHAARTAAMPHLLHTVALSETNNVHAFIRAIHIQHNHRRPNPNPPHSVGHSESRLAVDYRRYVKRMWCGICSENDPGNRNRNRMDSSHSLEGEWLDYRALWEVMRGVESLGIHFNGLHLLYNGLVTDFNIADATDVDVGVDSESANKLKGTAPESSSAQRPRSSEWNCRRVTFAGDVWRWIPLTSTPEGAAFLARITHLVMWIKYQSPPQLPQSHLHPSQTSTSSMDNLTPPWLPKAPFNMMRSLTDLGFYSNLVPTEMVVYHLPATPISEGDFTWADPDAADRDDRDPEQFRRWVVEDTAVTSASMDTNTNTDTVYKRAPLNLNFQVIQIPNTNNSTTSVNWESAWLTGQSEYSWQALL